MGPALPPQAGPGSGESVVIHTWQGGRFPASSPCARPSSSEGPCLPAPPSTLALQLAMTFASAVSPQATAPAVADRVGSRHRPGGRGPGYPLARWERGSQASRGPAETGGLLTRGQAPG